MRKLERGLIMLAIALIVWGLVMAPLLHDVLPPHIQPFMPYVVLYIGVVLCIGILAYMFYRSFTEGWLRGLKGDLTMWLRYYKKDLIIYILLAAPICAFTVLSIVLNVTLFLTFAELLMLVFLARILKKFVRTSGVLPRKYGGVLELSGFLRQLFTGMAFTFFISFMGLIYLPSFTVMMSLCFADSTSFSGKLVILGIIALTPGVSAIVLIYRLINVYRLKSVSSKIATLKRHLIVKDDVESVLKPTGLMAVNVCMPPEILPWKLGVLSWKGSSYLIIPKGCIFTGRELRAVLYHEGAHMALDTEVRYHELQRREQLKALLLGLLMSPMPVFFFLLIGFVLLFCYTLMLAPHMLFYIIHDYFIMTSELISGLIALLLLPQMFTVYSTALPFIPVLLMATLLFNFEILAVKFREARADFLAALKSKDPDALESALDKLRLIKEERKSLLRTLISFLKFPIAFLFKGDTSDPLLAFYFAAPEPEVRERAEKKRISLRKILSFGLKDVIWISKNVHPPIRERLYIIRMARALLEDGLPVEFRRELTERDYYDLAESIETLDRTKCLMGGIYTLCKAKGKFTLRELEERMAEEGHELAYEELFSALALLELRGIAEIRLPGPV